jgi:hypothetical protein
MGHWDDERGPSYSDYDLYACPACVNDSYLANVLADNLEDERCSYCGAAKAARISVLCDEISATIVAYYTDPAGELGYNSGEGGYQGVTYSTCEVVADLGDWYECEELYDDVVTAFESDDKEWCERNRSGLSDFEVLVYSWSDFSEQVKHRTRYLFLQKIDTRRESSGQIPPRKMLAALSDIFKEFELFRELPQGTDFFRVRVIRDNSRPTTAADLGTPPPKAANFPNRMSPAGIPMFYAALDEVTAVLETPYDPIKDKGKEIAIECFRNNKRPLMLLDLTNLPPVPSIFDLQRRAEHPRIAFLESFERDFTKPVNRDTEGHTEYVPTQVVTEFVRHRLRTAANKPVDGILYRSSRAGTSPAVVIFADPKDCGPRNRELFDPKPFLDFIDVQYVDFVEFKEAHDLLWLQVSPPSTEEDDQE